MKAPSMRFETKIFHPNIDWNDGSVCMDSLSTAWSPAWGPRTLFEGVLSLLNAPAQGADSPLNCDAANLLRQPIHDTRCFSSLAKMYAERLVESL
jgi:ubiquitin-protein ligase